MNIISAVALCGGGTSAWPRREGEVWWSVNLSTHRAGGALVPITDEALADWLHDTVGWHAVEISGEALLAAGAHASQVRPLVQAALQAGARMNTRKARLRQVDLDAGLARCLAMAMAAYPRLARVSLQELNVYDEGVAALANGLYSSEGLTRLSFRSVDVGDSGWEALAGAIKLAPSLTTLKIRDCLTRGALTAVTAAVKDWHTLQVLDLSGNTLNDTGVVRLCEALGRNTSVTDLRLARVGAMEAAVAGLAGLLRRGPATALTALDVSHNALGPEACAELGAALGGSPRLRRLVAAHTGWGDTAVMSTLASLTTATSLTALDIGYGRVGETACVSLAAAARKGALNDVVISGNIVGTAGVRAWADALASPRCALTALAVADCEAGDAAAHTLGAALRTNTVLTSLDVSANSMSQHGVARIIAALRTNTTLTALDVSHNWLGPRAMAAALAELTAVATPSATPSTAGKKEAQQQRAGALRSDAVNGTLAPGQQRRVAIKSEVLPEFREIERVKYGSWDALAAAAQTVQCENRTDDSDAVQGTGSMTGAHNPFLSPGHMDHDGGAPGGVQQPAPPPQDLKPGTFMEKARPSSSSSASTSSSTPTCTDRALHDDHHHSKARASGTTPSVSPCASDASSAASRATLMSSGSSGAGGGTTRRAGLGCGRDLGGAGQVWTDGDGLMDGSINAPLPLSFGTPPLAITSLRAGTQAGPGAGTAGTGEGGNSAWTPTVRAAWANSPYLGAVGDGIARGAGLGHDAVQAMGATSDTPPHPSEHADNSTAPAAAEGTTAAGAFCGSGGGSGITRLTRAALSALDASFPGPLAPGELLLRDVARQRQAAPRHDSVAAADDNPFRSHHHFHAPSHAPPALQSMGPMEAGAHARSASRGAVNALGTHTVPPTNHHHHHHHHHSQPDDNPFRALSPAHRAPAPPTDISASSVQLPAPSTAVPHRQGNPSQAVYVGAPGGKHVNPPPHSVPPAASVPPSVTLGAPGATPSLTSPAAPSEAVVIIPLPPHMRQEASAGAVTQSAIEDNPFLSPRRSPRPVLAVGSAGVSDDGHSDGNPFLTVAPASTRDCYGPRDISADDDAPNPFVTLVNGGGNTTNPFLVG